MTLIVFVSAAACGQQNFTGTAGAIQSPNYPQDYPDNTICRYQIFAPAGSKVRRNVYCKNMARLSPTQNYLLIYRSFA